MAKFDIITAKDIREAQQRAHIERAQAFQGLLSGIGGLFRVRFHPAGTTRTS